MRQSTPQVGEIQVAGCTTAYGDWVECVLGEAPGGTPSTLPLATQGFPGLIGSSTVRQTSSPPPDRKGSLRSAYGKPLSVRRMGLL